LVIKRTTTANHGSQPVSGIWKAGYKTKYT